MAAWGAELTVAAVLVGGSMAAWGAELRVATVVVGGSMAAWGAELTVAAVAAVMEVFGTGKAQDGPAMGSSSSSSSGGMSW